MIYYVYIKGDYAGTTVNLCEREKTHNKTKFSNFGTMQPVMATSNKDEALAYERYLQDNCGYRGRLGLNKKHRDKPRYPKYTTAEMIIINRKRKANQRAGIKNTGNWEVFLTDTNSQPNDPKQ